MLTDLYKNRNSRVIYMLAILKTIVIVIAHFALWKKREKEGSVA